MFMLLKENKVLSCIIITVLGIALLMGGVIWAVNAFTFKVATVDMDRLVKESKLGQSINKELQTTGNLYKAKLNAAKTDAERTQIQSDFQALQTAKQNDFFAKAKQSIAKVSKEKGIKAVANPQVFIYSENDLTESVIKDLNK